MKKSLFIIVFACICVFLSNIFVGSGNMSYVVGALSALMAMFVLPALAIRYVLHKSLRDFGLRMPENISEAVKLSLASIVIALPLLYFFSTKTVFQDYYAVKQGFSMFLLLSVGLGALYYFAEEFLFRGFLFFGLWDRLKFHSFWAASLIFALFHLGKPAPEVFWAFFLGLLFSGLAYKTKSIYPAVLVHLVIAFILNVLVNFA